MSEPGKSGGGFAPGSAASRRVEKRAAALRALVMRGEEFGKMVMARALAAKQRRAAKDTSQT